MALAVAGALAGCGTQAASGAGAASGSTAATAATCTTQSGPTVTFVDNQFQTLYIDNAVAEYIVRHGFCQPAKSRIMTTAVAKTLITHNQIDVWMEMWQQNFISWYNKAVAAHELVNLGPTYGSSTQGWYVPTYVIKGDPARGIKAMAPGLKSVSQLKTYWKVFQDPTDPSKGLFVNCIAAWNCSQVNEVLLYAFGLHQYFHVETPGAAPSLDAAIVGAYEKGQPILAYYWAPTWLLGKYKMTQLQMPKYTTACDAEIQKLIKDNEIAKATAAAGCGYENMPIDKGASAGFVKQDPQVAAFLQKMDLHDAPLEATAAYMQLHKASARKAALYFFRHYTEWEQWLPKTVEQRVAASLKADGVTVA
jgi:glycine betaine/proline transport system substrate-binding protein